MSDSPQWAGRDPLPPAPPLWALWQGKALVETGVGDPGDDEHKVERLGWRMVEGTCEAQP